MKPHSINASNNFIAGWYMDDTSLCDELMEYSLVSPDRIQGMTNKMGVTAVRKENKDSFDCSLNNNKPLYHKHLEWLKKCIDGYSSLYGEIQNTNTIWSDYEVTNIQHYPVGGGYKVWHTERSSGKYPISHRFLVFMTYLNTVEDAGGTEFMYQNYTMKAEKGLTILWPAEWTHTHRGIVSPTEEKWIVTGWLSFKKEE